MNGRQARRATRIAAAGALALAVGLAPARAWATDASATSVERPRLPVHAEAGLGFGRTLFFGGMREALRTSYGGAFDPGFGSNVMAGFVVAPRGWRGVGVGARIKGTFGSPVTGDGGDAYIFNDYALALQAKAYPFGVFDDGFYARATAGFGQLTTKRQDEAALRYRHQYAIGLTAGAALGYTLALGAIGVSLEAAFEYSRRNGTADGRGATTYETGQLAVNAVVVF